MTRIWKSKFKDHDVTDEGLYLSRRQIMAGAAGLGLGSIAGPAFAAPEGLEPNPIEDITNYNNYYEFGSQKEIFRLAQELAIRGAIRGAVRRAGYHGPEGGEYLRGFSRRLALDALCHHRG